MAFNTKQEDTNYTLMISKVSNGYVLHLLNEDGETVRSAIASEYAIRDYSSYSLCSAIEELWSYAEKLERDKQPQVAVPVATTMQQLLDEATAVVDFVAEAREADL
jgi:hypothetical protein